jgi:ring-1,2-phenylacetyl-CoA epoxidase subunit PaaC
MDALGLGDDALVMSQRLAEWCSRAPELEDDIALSNLALDLLGQARWLLSQAAEVSPDCVPALPEGSPVPAEDALAFFRDASEFRNVCLAEVPNGDFAHVVVRLLLFSVVRLDRFERLSSGLAFRAVKELAYHRDWSGRWFLTLARGTEESRRRLLSALDELWVHFDEMARVYEFSAAGDAVLDHVFATSGVERPEPVRSTWSGREGRHTQWLSPMLAEMQVVARAHPLGRW